MKHFNYFLLDPAAKNRVNRTVIAAKLPEKYKGGASQYCALRSEGAQVTSGCSAVDVPMTSYGAPDEHPMSIRSASDGRRWKNRGWKYVACMLLALVLGIGQMWGTDVTLTMSGPTSKTDKNTAMVPTIAVTSTTPAITTGTCGTACANSGYILSSTDNKTGVTASTTYYIAQPYYNGSSKAWSACGATKFYSTFTIPDGYKFTLTKVQHGFYILGTSDFTANITILDSKSVSKYASGNVSLTKQSSSGQTISLTDIDLSKSSVELAAGTYTLNANITGTNGSTGKYAGITQIKLVGTYEAAGGGGCTNVGISTQPTSPVAATVGSACSITGLVASGTSPSYQWYTCNSDGSSATAITAVGSLSFTGYQTATLGLTPTAAGTTYYKCVVSGSCGDPVTSNVVAVNATAQYTVTYNLNGGKYNGSSDAPTQSAVTSGTSITMPVLAPTKSGYAFTGWRSSVNNNDYMPSASYTMTAANTTFTAQWATACFEVPDARKNSDLAATITASMLKGSKIAGGTLTWENATDYTGNGTHGLILNEDGEQIVVTLNEGAFVAGSIITITTHGNSGTSTTCGVKVSGNNMTPATYSTESTGYRPFSQTYVVQAGDGIVGTNTFAIKRYNSNQVYIYSITVSGCGAASCTAPNHVDVSGRWDRFAGETISLTATAYSSSGTGSPIAAGSITGYQWQKYVGSAWENVSNGGNISGATTNNLQITSCTGDNSGTYRCNVSTGATCTTPSGGYQVKVYTLEIYSGTTGTYDFTRVGDTQAGTLSVNLAAGAHTFKIHADNNYYGNNAAINEDVTNWVFATTQGNCTLNAGLGGTFTINMEYSTSGNSSVEGEPEISVTYPRKTIYLVPNSDWSSNSAKFAFHYFRDGGSTGWTDFLTANDCGMSAEIPQWNGITVIAVRFNSSDATPGWNGEGHVWNQTDDITVAADKDLITITGWSNSQTYTAYSPTTYTVTTAPSTAGYGTVSAASVSSVACGTSISASTNTLTVGATNVTAETTTSTAQYTYAFDGWTWTPAGSTVTSDVTATANFTRTLNSYTVTWKNGSTTLETDASVDYGETPTYDGSTPTKDADALYTYAFSGWSPAVGAITGNTTYTAQFTATPKTVAYGDATIYAYNDSKRVVSGTRKTAMETALAGSDGETGISGSLPLLHSVAGLTSVVLAGQCKSEVKTSFPWLGSYIKMKTDATTATITFNVESGYAGTATIYFSAYSSSNAATLTNSANSVSITSDKKSVETEGNQTSKDIALVSGANTLTISGNNGYISRIDVALAPSCTSVAAPTALTCSAQTSSSLTFTWTEAANASGYVASLYDNSACTGDPVASSVLGDVATVTFSALTASTTYYCMVQSKGDGSTYCAAGGTTSVVSGTTSAAAITGSTSVNIEQGVLTNSKNWSYTSALTSANITYDLSSGCELDSLNDGCSKTDRNNNYLGLKIKSSGKYIQVTLPADKTMKVRFGYRAAVVKVWIDELAQEDIPITDTYYDYELPSSGSNRTVKIATSSDGAVVIKQIMIGEAIASVTLPAMITLGSTTNGTISVASTKVNVGSTVTVTATPSSGYELATLTYTKACPAASEPVNIDKTTKQFTMPNGNVTINATFAAACSAPTTAFANGSYTIGGSALDLSTLISSKQGDGTITYAVTDANGTGASIAGGTSFTATIAGTATVTATQAADGGYCEKVMDATITVIDPATPIITWTLAVGSTTWSCTPHTEDETNITSVSHSAPSGTIDTGNGTGDRTAKINIDSDVTDMLDNPTNYITFTFNVACNKKLTPDSVVMKVANVGGSSGNNETYKAVLSDNYGHGISAALCPTEDGKLFKLQIDNEDEVYFQGDVTLKVWAWNTKSSNKATAFRFGNLVKIVGTIANQATPAATITWTKQPAGGLSGTNETVTAVSSDGSAVTITSNNGSVATVAGSTVSYVGVGSTYLTASGTDACGNTMVSVNSDNFTVIGAYNLSYDANTGTGTMTGETGVHYAVVKDNGFTAPSGKVFFGWNTAANGSGDSYQPGDAIELNANTTLYAQWGTELTATWSVTKVDSKLYRGGGGYSVTVYLDQAEWDASGNKDDLDLTATEGVTLKNIVKSINGDGKAQVTADFDITIGVDADATSITFTLSVPAAGSYASAELEHDEDLTSCAATDGEVYYSYTISSTSAVTNATTTGGTFTSYNNGSTLGSASGFYTLGDNGISKAYFIINTTDEIAVGDKIAVTTNNTEFDLYTSAGVEVADNVTTYYTVVADDGIAGTHSFKIGRHDGGSQFKTFTVTSAGSSGGITPTLSWETDLSGGVEKEVGDADFTFTATQDKNSLGAITYSSNNTAVATVNATTGKVHIVGAAGEATITATLAASGCFEEATATYTINVVDNCIDEPGTITSRDLGCDGTELTVSGHTELTGVKYQWYKVGSPDEAISGATSATYTATAAGEYYVIVTNSGTGHCAMASTNTVTVTAKAAATATKIVNSWYVKNGRRTPDVALVQSENAESFTVKSGLTTIWESAGSTKTGFGGCGFHMDENGIIYLNGTTAEDGSGNAPSGLTGDADVTLTITAIGCGGNESKDITIHCQASTTRKSIAFVVDGTKDGAFDADNESHSVNTALYKYLDNTASGGTGAFDLTAQNIYATTDEKAIREHYSQFDAILITDDPGTKETPSGDYKTKGYVNAFGTMVDVRPILTMEAYVSALANWKTKGIAGEPTSPNPRQYALRLECKDHEIYKAGLPNPAPGTHVWDEVIGGETYRNVVLVDHNKSPYTGLADNEETAGNKSPALQGFDGTASGSLLGLGRISNGSLQAAIERQEEPAARLLVFSIQAKALPNALTEEGKIVIKNILTYLLKTNMEEVDDCSNYFTGKIDDDWSKADNWSKTELPSSEAKVRILTPCVIGVGTTARVAQVEIVSSGKSSIRNTGKGSADCDGALTISAGGSLIVGGKIRKAEAPHFGADDLMPMDDPSKLIINTGSTAQAALIFDNDDADTKATVNLYSLGRKTSSYQYQYFAVPMEVVPVNPTFANETHGGTGIYTYVYNEATSGWERRRYYDDLFAFEGLGITTKSTDPMNYTMTGNLASTATKEITLTHDGAGLNLIGNSWMAPIQIGALAEDNAGLDNQTVYIYCAGRDAVKGEATSGVTETAGQWIAIPFEAAEFEEWKATGKLSVIPAMQAFQIKVDAEATLTLDYDKVVRGSTNDLNAKLRAPGRRMAANEVTMTNIRVADSKTHTDLSLFEGDRFSEAFDNGWEAEYMNGDGRSAKLYAETEAGQMAVAAMYDYEGTVVGFAPGQETEYTFSFMGEDNGYYLNDIKLQNSVRISEGETYTFTYEEGDAANRFYISRTAINAPEVPTGMENLDAAAPRVQKIIYNDKLYIIRGGRLYDATGKVVK